MNSISPLAYIHPNAKIGKNVTIASYAYIDDDVKIGDNTVVLSKATILRGTRIGENCSIFSNSVIAAEPVNISENDVTENVIIGDDVTIREGVIIESGKRQAGPTTIGDDCLIMAYCQIGSSCLLKNNVIIGNTTRLEEKVKIDEFAIVSAATIVEKRLRIGAHVMVQGGSKVIKNIPPYVMAGREPLSYAGLNSVGLRRRGFTNESINLIKDIYRIVYLTDLKIENALSNIENEIEEMAEKREIVDFIRSSKNGIIGSLV